MHSIGSPVEFVILLFVFFFVIHLINLNSNELFLFCFVCTRMTKKGRRTIGIVMRPEKKINNQPKKHKRNAKNALEMHTVVVTHNIIIKTSCHHINNQMCRKCYWFDCSFEMKLYYLFLVICVRRALRVARRIYLPFAIYQDIANILGTN